MEHLRAKILYNHLEDLSVGFGDVSQEVADGIAYASTLCQLDYKEEESGGVTASIGGLTSLDVARFAIRRHKLSRKATEALADSLDNTLNDIALFYHASGDLGTVDPPSHALQVDEGVKADLAREGADVKELVSLLDTLLSLYQEASEVHLRLQTGLENAMRKLPTLLNANHTASNDLLALTIETSLLKLSVVRARMQASLYGYTSSSTASASMAQAVRNLHEKLAAQENTFEIQEHDLQSRLKDYQQLLELVDGQGGGFAQVVEDLATVRRETEDCRRDLRRLGWTEQ